MPALVGIIRGKARSGWYRPGWAGHRLSAGAHRVS